MHLGQMQKEEIAATMLTTGNQSEAARRIGMSPATVSIALRNDKELKAMIDAGFKELSGSWSKAIKNIKSVVDDYDTPIAELDGIQAKVALQRKEHGFKASERLIESMGLLPGTGQPTYIQNILVQNNNQYFSPLTEKALDQALNTIDAEIVEDGK